MKIASIVLALPTLIMIALAPAAHAAYSPWYGTDTCTTAPLTTTYCSVSASLVIEVDTPSIPCSKVGSTYTGCDPWVSCSVYSVQVTVPSHFSFDCSAFASLTQSCDILERGTFSGCAGGNSSDIGHTGYIPAGTCHTFTLHARINTLSNSNVPSPTATTLLDSAYLTKTRTLCVSSTTGASIT